MSTLQGQLRTAKQGAKETRSMGSSLTIKSDPLRCLVLLVSDMTTIYLMFIKLPPSLS